jgi:hypothetical protein
MGLEQGVYDKDFAIGLDNGCATLSVDRDGQPWLEIWSTPDQPVYVSVSGVEDLDRLHSALGVLLGRQDIAKVLQNGVDNG